VGHRVRRQEPGLSAGDSRKADCWIIAQRRDCFQCHVAGTLDRPFIVLFEQHRTDLPLKFHPLAIRVADVVKGSPNLGQPALEFSGVRLVPAAAPMSHSTAISAPCCRSRYGAGLRCSLYEVSRRERANHQFKLEMYAIISTNHCSNQV
jgi:hypothetical protein